MLSRDYFSGNSGRRETFSIRNPAVFPRIPSETRVSFVPILIEWMKRGGKIGRNAPFSAFSRASANGTGLTVSEVKPKVKCGHE
jgi:hypothetical protein